MAAEYKYPISSSLGRSSPAVLCAKSQPNVRGSFVILIPSHIFCAIVKHLQTPFRIGPRGSLMTAHGSVCRAGEHPERFYKLLVPQNYYFLSQQKTSESFGMKSQRGGCYQLFTVFNYSHNRKLFSLCLVLLRTGNAFLVALCFMSNASIQCHCRK